MLPLVVASLLLPVVGHGLFLVGGVYLTAIFLGYDYMDFCMARREWSFSRKWRALKDNRALALGLGGGLALVMLVPILGLLSLPMAAVGGTLLFCDLERAGAFTSEIVTKVAPGTTSGINGGQDG
jgi:CysZ protein